jgi:hypothetical protein
VVSNRSYLAVNPCQRAVQRHDWPQIQVFLHSPVPLHERAMQHGPFRRRIRAHLTVIACSCNTRVPSGRRIWLYLVQKSISGKHPLSPVGCARRMWRPGRHSVCLLCFRLRAGIAVDPWWVPVCIAYLHCEESILDHQFLRQAANNWTICCSLRIGPPTVKQGSTK